MSVDLCGRCGMPEAVCPCLVDTTPAMERVCTCVHFRASHPGDGACTRTLCDWDGNPDWRCPCRGYSPRAMAPAAASPAAGVIADRLRDAGASAYSARLAALWQETTDPGPWED